MQDSQPTSHWCLQTHEGGSPHLIKQLKRYPQLKPPNCNRRTDKLMRRLESTMLGPSRETPFHLIGTDIATGRPLVQAKF